MSHSASPVFFFAFANNRIDRSSYLRNLPEEQRRVREAMGEAVKAGLCEVLERGNATVKEVLDVFQDGRFRDRIALFHFGGHADDGALIFESSEGAVAVAHAAGLARFLGEQRALELVFLNGCSSRGQAEGLLAAGVPAVIATSQSIDDEVATEFSSRFYAALASGVPVSTAFNEAAAAVQTLSGDLPQRAYATRIGAAKDRWPWDLYVAPGAEERVRRWSLPLVARNPLFGLPSPPILDLPLSPFKHLASFTREDAPIFFGRGREIRELFEAITVPDGAPIVLLFGATGVGKSSLLCAGLQPRLESSHDVLYLRRDRDLGLAGTLECALEAGGESAAGAAMLSACWLRREEMTGKPLVVILDQAEEAWTRPLGGGGETEDFGALLRALFALREARPRGRLVLSFRKEWLAEGLRLLNAEKLPRARVEVGRLDQDGVAEVVTGLASSERLKQQYRLEIDPELPGLIAGDLLEDPAATVTPALQVLLTRMWVQATEDDPTSPRFTVELYQGMKRRGILLDDFVEEQLGSLRQWRPEAVDSGLALDLLAYYTTPLGTAETRLDREVLERYGGRQDVAELLEGLKDRYLVTRVVRFGEGELPARQSRLAHDTLAPLVRRRFESSDLPGQRALRILQQRALEWEGGRAGVPLDDFDLAVVECGEAGMRARTPDEDRLVDASRRQADRRIRRQRGLRFAAVVTALLILAASLLAWRQRQQAVMSEQGWREALATAEVERSALLRAEGKTAASMALLSWAARLDPESLRARSLLVRELLSRNWLLPVLASPRLEGHPEFSSGARFFAIENRGGVRVFDSATLKPVGKTLRTAESRWRVRLSDDGRRVATWDRGEVWLRDVGTGRTLGRFRPPAEEEFYGYDASPDLRWQFFYLREGGIVAWAAGHGGHAFSLPESLTGKQIAISPAGGKLAVWEPGTAEASFWDLAARRSNGGLMATGSVLSSLEFSGDGRRLVTTHEDGMLRLWDAASGRLLSTIQADSEYAQLSENGQAILSWSRERLEVWKPSSPGAPIFTLQGRFATAAVLRGDGEVLLANPIASESIELWDVTSGERLCEPIPFVSEARFVGAGSRLIAVDRYGGVRVWDTASSPTRERTARLRPAVRIVRAVLSSASHYAAIWEESRGIGIWETGTGRLVKELPIPKERGEVGFEFSENGRFLALLTRRPDDDSQMQIRVWDIQRNRAAGPLIQGPRGSSASTEDCLQLSPDGSRLAVISPSRTLRILDVATGRLLMPPFTAPAILLVARFSPTGEQVVVGGADGAARILDVRAGATATRVPLVHESWVYSVLFSPDGRRVATGSNGGLLRIWDAESGRLLADPVKIQGWMVNSLQFDRAGLNVLGWGWSSASLIEITSGRAQGRPIPLRIGGTPVQLSPDGTRVAVATPEHVVELLDARTGTLLASIPLGEDIFDVRFSPDGQRLWIASGSQVGVWDVPVTHPADTELLAVLAEAVSGNVFNSDENKVVPLYDPLARLQRLRALTTGAMPDPSAAASLTRWILSDPRTRQMSPLSVH